MVGRRRAGTGQMGVGRLAVVARGLMQRVFSRGTGHDERRSPWLWVRRRLTEGGLRCGSRGGRWSSESWSKGRGRCARRDGVGLGAVVVLGLGRPAGGRSGGDRGRTCASRTAMSSRRLRSAPSGLGENAVADRKVRPRRRQRRQPGERGRSGGRRGCGGRVRAGLSGQGGGWPGVPGAIRLVAAQRTAPTEGLRSRGGHGWGSMRDCGGNRKDLVGIGVESLTWAVYASALRALCVLVRGVSALRTGSGPSEPVRA